MEPVAALRRSGGVQRLVSLPTVILPALILAACISTPTPTALGSGVSGPSNPELAAGTARQGELTLSVTAEPAVMAVGETIDVRATVSNEGEGPLVVSGPGSGIVFFSVTRVQDGLSSGPPVIEDDCSPHEFAPGQSVVYPFKKSGAFTDDDADADFRRSYFADPELRLPSGTWRIDISTAGVVGEECRGEPLEIEISLVVTVTE